MRRILGGFLAVIAATGIVTAAGADTAAPASKEIEAPYVGFDPLFSPWWVQDAGRTPNTHRWFASTHVYSASGADPTTVPAVAITSAMPGVEAALCGSPEPFPVPADGAIANAVSYRSGDTIVVRAHARTTNGRDVTVTARGLDPLDVEHIVAVATKTETGIEPYWLPGGMSSAGSAPISATLAAGAGTRLRLIPGQKLDQPVDAYAFEARGHARAIEQFMRTTVVPLTCQDRYAIRRIGRTTVVTTSAQVGLSSTVARMVRRVGRREYQKWQRWAQHPDPSRLARRCKAPGIVTLAGENHGHVWAVGLPITPGGVTCTASPGGACAQGSSASSDPVSVAVGAGSCGRWLVAGRAPVETRRIDVRARPSAAQHAHLRLMEREAVTLWAAFIRTPKIAYPRIDITAHDQQGRVVGRSAVPRGAARRCHGSRATRGI